MERIIKSIPGQKNREVSENNFHKSGLQTEQFISTITKNWGFCTSTLKKKLAMQLSSKRTKALGIASNTIRH
jgi:hypothetical protein